MDRRAYTGPDNHLHHAPQAARSAPNVSVILLVHHSAPLRTEVIASIQTQSFVDWELIIVANGAAASSLAAIERDVQHDQRIRVDVRSHLSLTQARQAGFELARGQYIYCLDANYVCLPNTLQRLYDALEAQPAAVAAYGSVVGMQPTAHPLGILAQLVDDHVFQYGAVAMRCAALQEARALIDSDVDDQTLWWLLTANGPVLFVEGGPLSAPTSAPATVKSAPLKLAYLIVAHHQPNHLARLIRALDDEHSFFFIHIDGKVPLASFQALVPPRATIVWLANRVDVRWGTMSVVQAELNLIQTAAASGQAFTYYTLLSGSDYPIKPKEAIASRLHASNQQFLRIDRKLSHAANSSHRDVIKNLPQGTYFGNLTPYHGSMYWSLSADCIRFILDFVATNPGYVEIHHTLFAPDEVFFHTLVKHSPFADQITQDFSHGRYPDHTHHGNHFINWRDFYTRGSLTLDERALDELLASPALFARKFDEHQSSTLLDILDQHNQFVPMNSVSV